MTCDVPGLIFALDSATGAVVHVFDLGVYENTSGPAQPQRAELLGNSLLIDGRRLSDGPADADSRVPPTPTCVCVAQSTNRLYVTCAEQEPGIFVFDCTTKCRIHQIYNRSREALLSTSAALAFGRLLLNPRHTHPACLDANERFLFVGQRDHIVTYRLSNGMRAGPRFWAHCHAAQPLLICNMCTVPGDALAVLGVRDIFRCNAGAAAARASEINVVSLQAKELEATLS